MPAYSLSQILRKRLRSADRSAIEALRHCWPSTSDLDSYISNSNVKEALIDNSDESIIVLAMQRLFKLSVRRQRIKVRQTSGTSFIRHDTGFTTAKLHVNLSNYIGTTYIC